MSSIGFNIPDEIIAAHIDNGNLTPLEKSVYSPYIEQDDILEIKEIVMDARKSGYFSDYMVSMERTDAIENFISRLGDGKELKSPDMRRFRIM